MKTDLRCVPGKKKYSPIENAVHYIDIYKQEGAKCRNV